MNGKTKIELSKARVYYRAWKLNEAYSILRRYFDRLPFRPEKDHAVYIGMFIRTLLELGKEWELKFYMETLENWYQKTETSEIGFQLAYVYCHYREPKLQSAISILEKIIADSEGGEFHIKARLLLAHCLEATGEGVNVCRSVIEAIPRCEDPELQVLVEIWKAKILRDEERYEEAEKKLRAIIQSTSPQENWYPYFSANNVLGILFSKTGRFEELSQIVLELTQLIEKHPFKSVRVQIEALKSALASRDTFAPLLLTEDLDQILVQFDKKSATMQKRSPGEKLLRLFAAKKTVTKESVVKSIYERQYRGGADDNLVYYQIHSLRKFLKSIGLPPSVIAADGAGYHFTSEVKFAEENR